MRAVRRVPAIIAISLLLLAIGAFVYRVSTVEPLTERPFPLARRPFNIAHRGGAGVWPENTLYAFRHAYELGVDVLELDVHSTADGQIVVIHDDSVDRTSNGSGKVEDMTLADLRKLDFSTKFLPAANRASVQNGRVGILTLQEVFAQFPDCYINIEIKTDSPQFASRVIDLINWSGMIDRVLLNSFHPRIAKIIEQQAEGIAKGASKAEIRQMVILSRLGLAKLHRPAANAYQVPVSRNGVEIVTPAFVRAAHDLGQEVHVWTIDDSTEMRRLLKMGVDGIMTDRPDILAEVLKEFKR